MAWDDTPKKLEEIRDPADVEEEERLKREAEAAAAKGDDDVVSGDGADVVSGSGKAADDVVSGSGKAADDVLSGSGKAADDVLSGKDGDGVDGPMSDGDGVGDGDMEGDQDDMEETKEEAPKPRKRKKYLHHPFEEKDFASRRASEEYAKIKEIEDRVLSFKKEGVKTYVISAGVLYGLGEAIFNNHFEKAWK